jgi:hypothetical protein
MGPPCFSAFQGARGFEGEGQERKADENWTLMVDQFWAAVLFDAGFVARASPASKTPDRNGVAISGTPD